MLNSTVLEVAIGLIFCYASVALIVSSVYEAIASWFNLRAKNLLAGIGELLNTKSDSNHDLLLHIYNDALAHPAGSGDATSIKDVINKPSYIPPNNFALALIHAIQQVQGKADTLYQDIETIKDKQLRKMLSSLYVKSAGDAEKFQCEVASWFDAGMVRISGVYKKQSQIWCFVIALIFAVFLNIDSVHLFKTLWLHPATMMQLNVALNNSALVDQVYTQLQILPVGWNNQFSFSALLMPSAIMGWLITASASLFGAPFWFDILKIVVRLRGTEAKPDQEKNVKS